jgi:hypothetical protein
MMILNQTYMASQFARQSLATAAILAAAALAGCQQTGREYNATVQGTVTIDGELAPRGMVTFNPVASGPVATGRIHEDGSYSIRTGQGDLSDPDGGKIHSGEYVVTVEATGPPDPEKATEKGGPPAMGPRLIADKYAVKDSSGLTFTVKAGPNLIDLKLDGPWANPPKEDEAGVQETVEEDKGEVEAAPDAKGDAAQEADDASKEGGAPEASTPADVVAPADGAVPADAASSDQSTEAKPC